MIRYRLINYANLVSISRVVLAGPIAYMLTTRLDAAIVLALFFMCIAEFSDWLDGRLARGLDQVTDIGKVLDPMADSVYRIFVFTAFVANEWLSALLFAPFLVRDIIVSSLRSLAQSEGIAVGARMSGKIKAIAQAAAQLLVVWSYANWGVNISNEWQLFINSTLFIAAIITIISMFDYIFNIYSLLRTKELV